MLCDLASAVRCAKDDDASRLLVRIETKQRADQNAAETVPHEMNGIGIELNKKARQALGVFT